MTLHDSLYYASQEDIEFFNRATAGLPKREPDEPYHCGPQCVKGFEYAVDQIEAWDHDRDCLRNPRVLEIGFNLGHSAACWQSLSCNVISMDIRHDERVESSIRRLTSNGLQFTFIIRSDSDLLKKFPTPDLAFIDGAHDYDSVIKDIQLCREHGVTRFLFDDWYPHHGPGVQPAVFDAGLLPLAIVGSMAYCVDPKEHGYIKLPEIV